MATPQQRAPRTHQLEGGNQELFQTLADEWRRDTARLSLASDKVKHPAYQRIISMGRPAVPLILRDLDEHGGFWYNALESLADGSTPVRPQDRGNVKKMKAAWLQWGRDNGFID